MRPKTLYVSWQELEKVPRKRRTTVLTRLAGAIATVMVFSIATNSLLNYFSFQKSHQETIRSTFSSIVEELGFKIESSLNLGLPLSSVSNIPVLLEQTFHYHEKVKFVRILSPSGTPVFAEAVNQSEEFNLDSSEMHHDEETGLRYYTANDTTVIGYDLYNSYDQLTGILQLGYDQSYSNYVQKKVRWALLKSSVIVQVIFISIAFITLYVLIYKFRHRMADLENKLENLVDQNMYSPDISEKIGEIHTDMERIGMASGEKDIQKEE